MARFGHNCTPVAVVRHALAADRLDRGVHPHPSPLHPSPLPPSPRRPPRHRVRWAVAVIALSPLVGAAAEAPGERMRGYLERAVAYIEAQRPELARTYLEPVLISPWITSVERAQAYYYRGFSFDEQGFHVSAAQDYLRALEFNRAQPAAIAALSHLYAQGLGHERNEALAFNLAQEAANAGNRHAQTYVGQTLLEQGDMAAARELLGPAAQSGYVPAQLALARSWRRPLAAEPNAETARRWLVAAHQQGSAEAGIALAHMYRDGEFGEPDAAEAARRFGELAASGHPHAQAALAHMLLTGAGVPADAGRARALYLAAAEAGLPAAFLGLGHMAETAGDMADAQRWYQRGAERDDPAAQYRLGRLLATPSHGAHFAAGLDWLERAAGAGHAGAQNHAAWILATSRTPSHRNGTLAVHLAERAVAAEQNADTLDTLAAAYAEHGDFPRAIETQQAALERLDDGDARHQELNMRLKSYHAGQPWRQ